MINPSLSSVGSYTITYTTSATCSGSTSLLFEIFPADSTFSFSKSSYCSDQLSSIIPTITGSAGGIFSASPAIGLSFNPSTGVISPSGSNPGIYNITYRTPSAKNLSAPLPQIDNIVGHYPLSLIHI